MARKLEGEGELGGGGGGGGGRGRRGGQNHQKDQHLCVLDRTVRTTICIASRTTPEYLSTAGNQSGKKCNK